MTEILKDRAVIITGNGSYLGRAHAMAMEKEIARIRENCEYAVIYGVVG